MITRRRFLRGAAGAALALPMLESVRFLGGRRKARAGGDPMPVYGFWFRQGNGVQQAQNGEPERFWPRARGALTRESLLATDADRAVSELADHADRLLLVSGTRYAFDGAGCAHSGGMNQCLTAHRADGDGPTSMATGPSVDYLIAKAMNPGGGDPLTLLSGNLNGEFIPYGLSYAGPRQPRASQNNPFAVYLDLVGLGNAEPEVLEALARQRKSVNDLVRAELTDLMSKPDLSGADRQRLQLHFDAVRDLEVRMSCELATGEVDAMEAIQNRLRENSSRFVVARMHLDLVAMAFACDLNRVATLQMGQVNDQTRYTVDGVEQNSFHRVSHRIDSDGATGTPIPNADLIHHKIDRMMLQQFKYFLDRLATYAGPSGGTLLDDSFSVFTSDLAAGWHAYNNLPQIIAGSAGGYLKQGQYIDAGNVTHNRLLNTLATAAGLRNGAGEAYDGVGDASLQGGIIQSLVA